MSDARPVPASSGPAPGAIAVEGADVAHGDAAHGNAAHGDVPLADLPFDRSLEELRDVVARLEGGGMPLEDSIALYERGVALHDHCARLLAAAELRVQRLVEAAGGAPRALDMRPGDEDEGRA